MSSTDTRIVQMQFDNKQFESGVSQTMNSLDRLEDSLQLKGATDGMKKVSEESRLLCNSMDAVDNAIETVKIQFSYLQVAGITAMVRLTDYAINYGKKIYNAIFGQIISGGKIRSQNIENAKFQLEGLGVAWEDIKGDIDYGVQDTAYGLDEAARVASQLVASGVDIGKNMQTSLRSISGVAAMTNSSYSEIGDIFTTVASNGKLMTMQLRQLSARGLNVSAALAKELNKTEEEINDLVSKGKIGFQEFADAMDSAFGEHAKEANKTFQGAFSNIKAALSRIGQKFADPVYENLKNIFNAYKPAIDAVNKALDPMVNGFKNIFGTLSGNLVLLGRNQDFIEGLQNIVINIWSYMRPIVVALQKVGFLTPNIEGIARSFKDVTGSLQLYGDNAVKVENIFVGLFLTLKNVFNTVKTLATGFAPLFNLIWNSVKFGINLLAIAGRIVQQVTPAVNEFVQAMSILINYGLTKGIEFIFNKLAELGPKLMEAIGMVGKVGQIAWKFIKPIFDGIIGAFSYIVPVITIIFNLLSVLDFRIVAAAGIIIAAILGLFKVIKYLKPIINFVHNLFGLVGKISSLLSAYKEKAKTEALINKINSISMLFLAFAASMKIISTINWKSFEGSAVYLVSGISLFFGVFALVTVLAKDASLKGTASVVGSLGAISFVFLSIAAIFKILSSVNWAGLSGSAPYLISAIGLVIALMAAINVMGTSISKSKIGGVKAIKNSLLSISGLFLSMAVTFKILSSVNWAGLSGSEPYLLSAIGLVIALMAAIGVMGTSISKNKIGGVKAIKNSLLSISGLFLSMAVTFKILGSVNWAGLSGSEPYLISAIGLIIALMAAIVVMGKEVTPSKLAGVIAMSTSLLIISNLFLSIAVTFKILSMIDWSGLSGSEPYLLSAIGLIITLMAAIVVMGKAVTPSKLAGVIAMSTSLLIISGLFLSIAVTFKILSMIDWSGLSGSEPYLLSAIGLIITLMAAIVVMGKAVTPSKLAGVIAMSTSLLIISNLFLSIAVTFKLLSGIDWNGLTNSAPYLLSAILLVITLMAAVVVMGSAVKNIAAVYSATAAMAAISILFISIALTFEILDSVDWASLNAGVPFLLSAVVILIVLLGEITILAAISNGLNLVPIIAILGAVAILIATLSYTILILGAVKWDAIDVNAITKIGQFVLILMGIITLLSILCGIPAIGEGVMAGLAIISLLIITLSGLALSIGFAFKTFAEAMSILAMAMAQMQIIDWSVINTIITGVTTLVNSLIWITIQAAAIGIGVGALGIALILLATGLAMFTSMVDPTVINNTGLALNSFFTMIANVFQNNSSGILMFSVFILALPVLAGALALAGVLLMAAAGSLVITGALLSLGGDMIVTGLTSLINSLIQVEPLLVNNYEVLLSAMGGLAIVGAGLIASGALLLIGSVIFLAASAILWAGSKLLPLAVEALLLVVDAIDSGDIDGVSDTLTDFAWKMANSGLSLVVGSGLFMLGSMLFMGASTVFKNGATVFNEGVQELASAVEEALAIGEQLEEAGENVIGGFVDGIESVSDTVSSTMESIAENGVIGTLCDALEIHSPSEVLRELGLDTLAGYVEGLEEGQSPTEVIMQAISDGISELGFTDLFGEGFNTTDSLCDGLEIGGGNCMSYMNSLAGGISNSCDSIIQDLKDTIYALSRASDYAELYGGKDSYAYQQYQQKLENAKAELERYEMGSYDKIELPSGGSGGGSAVSTDMPDVSKALDSATGSGSGGGSNLASSIASNSGVGTGINDLSKGGTNINSNNTYNFVQNNYSPKELDRTEIYTQTNYQMKRWYGWLQSNR